MKQTTWWMRLHETDYIMDETTWRRRLHETDYMMDETTWSRLKEETTWSRLKEETTWSRLKEETTWNRLHGVTTGWTLHRLNYMILLVVNDIWGVGVDLRLNPLNTGNGYDNVLWYTFCTHYVEKLWRKCFKITRPAIFPQYSRSFVD